MTGKLGISFPVVEKMFGWDSTLESRKDVLSGDTMTWKKLISQRSITKSEVRTSFVKNDGVVVRRSLEKSQKYANFRDSIVCTT